MQKVGRNDPCPCGSGKKYKKCCEEKVKQKKFNAQLLSEPPAQNRLSSLFQHNVKNPPPKPLTETKETSEKPL